MVICCFALKSLEGFGVDQQTCFFGINHFYHVSLHCFKLFQHLASYFRALELFVLPRRRSTTFAFLIAFLFSCASYTV
jgi:hypothetical protein